MGAVYGTDHSQSKTLKNILLKRPSSGELSESSQLLKAVLVLILLQPGLCMHIFEHTSKLAANMMALSFSLPFSEHYLQFSVRCPVLQQDWFCSSQRDCIQYPEIACVPVCEVIHVDTVIHYELGVWMSAPRLGPLRVH